MQNKIESLREKKRIELEEIEKFKISIRRGSKRDLSIEKLKKLNTLYKINYIEKVIEENE